MKVKELTQIRREEISEYLFQFGKFFSRFLSFSPRIHPSVSTRMKDETGVCHIRCQFAIIAIILCQSRVRKMMLEVGATEVERHNFKRTKCLKAGRVIATWTGIWI